MKKLFFLITAIILMGAMASCNGNLFKDKKASAIDDSISTQLGKMIGANLNQMLKDPRAQAENLDRDEILKGIETILNCDTSKNDQSYMQGIMIAMQMIYPGIAQSEGQGFNIDRKMLMSELKKAFNSKDSLKLEEMQAMQASFQGLMERAMKAKGIDPNKVNANTAPQQNKDNASANTQTSDQEEVASAQEETASKPATCSMCGGSGKVKCSQCKGRGQIYYSATGGIDGCRKCGGSGSAGGEENNVRRGSGKMTCPKCHGSGKV